MTENTRFNLPAGVSVRSFRFLGHAYDPVTGEATLSYAFDEGEALVETIRFPYQPWPSDPSRQAAFGKALGLLHLVAGVSYYKACIPEIIDTGEHQLDSEAADFLDRLYVHGLAEFAWKNQVELRGRVSFPATRALGGNSYELDLPDRSLVAMGGGKDSLVSLEILREAGNEIQPFCVGESELIANTVKAAGLPLIQIGRTLSPALARMNEAGALNGHVPVTAINSAIGLCAAILYGHRWVVFSNESSADEETLTDDEGRQVNHQYSKSLAFEQELRDIVTRHISPNLEYFSLLRPLKDLLIASKFSKIYKYHKVFSSCNRNFHIEGSRIDGRWCNDCPKCRFTALALAPFVEPGALNAIMGIDILDQPEQEQGFRALCRLCAEKPFECVGSVDECRAAIQRLATLDAWKDKAIVRALAPELDALPVPSFESLLTDRGTHCIPPEVVARVAF